MFVAVEMVDTVRIPPWNFQRQFNEAIAEELNKKLANKVRGCSTEDTVTNSPYSSVVVQGFCILSTELIF